MLGTSALTLVTLTSATAAPVIETGDFGDTFATRTILASQGPVYGTLGGSDLFDYFQLSGFGAGQSIRIVLTQIAQLPEPSASASASSSTDASGSDEPTSSTDASASGEPTDVGFTLHLLDETGAFDPLAGDSGPDPAASADAFPDGQVFGDRSFAFDLDSSTLPTGDLNLRLAFDGTENTFYQVTVTARAASTVSEPSSILPLAAGAAGLGFLAARRRRRKK